MRLSAQRLNRTLLRRQHLLERAGATVEELTRHLVGLQAQENLSPFLSLNARLESFDPYDVSRGLDDRSLVRLLVLRGTVHLLPADDVGLRTWTTPVHEREVRVSRSIGARQPRGLVGTQRRLGLHGVRRRSAGRSLAGDRRSGPGRRDGARPHATQRSELDDEISRVEALLAR